MTHDHGTALDHVRCREYHPSPAQSNIRTVFTGCVKLTDVAFEYVNHRRYLVWVLKLLSARYTSRCLKMLVRSDGTVTLCVIVEIQKDPHHRKTLDLAVMAPKLLEQHEQSD